MKTIGKIFGILWKGIKKVFEWISIGIGVWVVIILGGWLLIILARSATLGFGIAVAGIAVGAGIAGGIYFIFRNKEKQKEDCKNV